MPIITCPFTKILIIEIFFISIYFIFFLKFIFDLEIFENVGSGLYKLTWINIFFPFVYVLMLLKLLKFINIQRHYLIFFYSNFSFCSKPFCCSFYKQNISNKFNNYNNIYTFSGYYRTKDFIEFRKLIKEDRAVSVGLDPMIVAMNNKSD